MFNFRFLLVATAALALAACRIGEPRLDASQAADELVGPSSMHPGALTVQVTAATADIQVRGVRSVGGAKVTEEDRFPMGSLTKAMTATLAGVLVQDGMLGWDTKLLDVFPELAATARPDYANVTLRDLLAHRSGIFPAETPDEIAELPELSGSPKEQRVQIVRWALMREPAFPPGTRSGYSNGGYVAAAAMLERVSALDYEYLMQARVFAALGASIAFGGPGSAGGPLGHTSADGKQWTPVPADDELAQFPAFANPAGGALLRGADLAAFLQLHLRALSGKQGLLITPQTAATLHQPVQGDYALGWLDGQGLDGKPLSWHNGSDDVSYYALMSVSRANGLAAAAAVNGLYSGTEAALSSVVSQMLARRAER